MWRATFHPANVVVDEIISIHALRVEGDRRLQGVLLRPGISIHALRVEGDEATTAQAGAQVISIHALRVEGDRPPSL